MEPDREERIHLLERITIRIRSFDLSGLWGAWARIPAVRRGASTPRFQEVETSARISRRWRGRFRAFRPSLRIMYTLVGHRPAPRLLGYRRYRD